MPVPPPTQAQVDEQLQEAIVCPLASLVEVASYIADSDGNVEAVGIDAGHDLDVSDSASDEDDSVSAVAGKAPQVTPASVHAAGVAAAQEAEELQKTARVTKLALKKLARAAATTADEDVKKDLEQQAANLRLSAPSKEFSSELCFSSTAVFLPALRIHSSSRRC
jgi:hypothetical protein